MQSGALTPDLLTTAGPENQDGLLNCVAAPCRAAADMMTSTATVLQAGGVRRKTRVGLAKEFLAVYNFSANPIHVQLHALVTYIQYSSKKKMTIQKKKKKFRNLQEKRI